uniref:Uncharacterized protein n=1 Tax=Anguilla anguilla TaxID=7936 RepID=A0A0E9W2S7_ANGAN
MNIGADLGVNMRSNPLRNVCGL